MLAFVVYSVGAYLACEAVLKLVSSGRAVDALVLIDPAFQSGQVPEDLAERVMASSVMDNIPDDLDAPRFRGALINLFPSYAPRFTATSSIDLSADTLAYKDTQRMTVPSLLIISTEPHPVFSPVSGGPTAEVEWKARLPQAAVVHVKSTHLSIPYTAETGWSILQFLSSVSGVAFPLSNLLAGCAKFEEIDRVMASARRTFRQTWAEKHAGTDFRRAPLPTQDHAKMDKQGACQFKCNSTGAIARLVQMGAINMEALGYEDIAIFRYADRIKLFMIARTDLRLAVADAQRFLIYSLEEGA